MIHWRPEVSSPKLPPTRPTGTPASEPAAPLPQEQLTLTATPAPVPTAPPATAKTPDPAEAAQPSGPAPHVAPRVSVATTLQMTAAEPASAEPLQLGNWENIARQTFFNPLAAIPAEQLGPLGDLLSLPPGADLMPRKPAIRNWAENRQAFVKAYDQSLAGEQPVQALRQLEDQWLTEKDKVTPEMRTMLIEGYRSKGAHAEVARLYERSLEQDPNFKHYEIPREYFIVALNKTKQTLRSIAESENFIQERLSSLYDNQAMPTEARHLAYRQSGLNGEIFAGLGRAYKDIHSAAQKEINSHIDGSGLAPLLQELTGSRSQDWSFFGGARLGDQARKKLTDSQLSALADFRSGKLSAENLKQQLAEQAGLHDADWPQAQARLEELKQMEGPLHPNDLERLSGRPLEQWPGYEKQVQDLTHQSIRPFVQKFLSGKGSAAEAVDGLGKATGVSLQGPIAHGAVIHKLEDLRGQLSSTRWNSEMAEALARTGGSEVRSNLLLASQRAMEVSRDYYVDGFAIDFEYYPGVNAVYNNLFLGNTQEAERLAPMVLSSCEREGGRTTRDYWNLATQLELGLISNNPASVARSLPRALEHAKAGWELETTLESIDKLIGIRRMDAADTRFLEFAAEQLRTRIDAGFPPSAQWNKDNFLNGVREKLSRMPGVPAQLDEQLDPERVEVTNKLLEKSTRFNEVFNSKFVGGNVPFGGQVADIPINRSDVRALRQVLAELELDKVTDYATFNERIDAYVENRFGLVDPHSGRRVLEDLHSEEHKVMDRFSSNRHQFTEARTSGASKTNLVTELTLGTGDCRHTGISKQAFFDVWKRDHQSGHLKNALKAAQSGDQQRYQQEMDRVKEWDRTQMVKLTMTFQTAIDLRRNEEGKPMKYALVLDDQGRPMKNPDGTVMDTEDHTFNAIMRTDEQGLVLPYGQGGLVTQDVFYKHFYRLEEHELDPRQVLDSQGFDLGFVGVQTPEGELLPVKGLLTRHSGNPPKPIAGECGQTTFGGLAVAYNSAEALTQPRENQRHLVELVSRG